MASNDSLSSERIVRRALKDDRVQRFIGYRTLDETKWSSAFVDEFGAQLRTIAEQDKPQAQSLLQRLYGLLNGVWPKRVYRESFLPDVDAAQDIFVLREQSYRVFYTVELQSLKGGMVVQVLRFWAVIQDDYRRCGKVRLKINELRTLGTL